MPTVILFLSLGSDLYKYELLLKELYKEITHTRIYTQAFPGGTVAKNPPANAGDPDSILGLGRSPGEGND